jgi:hypothetical protein
MDEKIEKLKKSIPKLKGNKKILPQAIEAFEWELKYLQLKRENEELKTQLQVAYNETFVDGTPNEMDRAEIIRQFLIDYFGHVIKE